MNEHYPFENPPLPYEYSGLEPYIDTQTMHLHHDKHLQTYVDNLNKLLEPYPTLHLWSLEKLIRLSDRLPPHIQMPVKNNAGGVYNHILYFNGMQNKEPSIPVGSLAKRIDNTFDSYDNFKEAMTTSALSVFGSGYAWLVADYNKRIKIISTPNQNTPFSFNLSPILLIDVWEHAYYLKHYNKRVDYIADWLSIINWEQAENNYIDCK